MDESAPELGPPLPPLTDEEVVSVAREIVTGRSLIADTKNDDWVRALTLVLPTEIPANLGLIVVPVASHRGLWLNGCVPFPAFEARLVADESVPALRTEVQRMTEALYPDATQTPAPQG